MKKYMKPVTECFEADNFEIICASPGGRQGDWGNDGSDEHGNGDWNNQGWNTGGENIDDDEGEIDAQSKNGFDLWW